MIGHWSSFHLEMVGGSCNPQSVWSEMSTHRIPQQSQTLGIIGFILLIPSIISWILFILFLSGITNLFNSIYKVIPWLVIVIFTINPFISIILGVLSRNYESRNVYANVARIGGYMLMGFLLIAIILRWYSQLDNFCTKEEIIVLSILIVIQDCSASKTKFLDRGGGNFIYTSNN